MIVSPWPTSHDSWLDPRLEIRPSPISGRGTFATQPIPAGQIVILWVHRILTKEETALAPPGLLLERSDHKWIWQPPDDPNAPDNLLNHSCNPNLWMADEVSLATTRAIDPNEELTSDYALFELEEDWLCKFLCNCGQPNCRRTITGRDWMRPELQLRYAGHFHPEIQKRIASGQLLSRHREQNSRDR